MTPRCSVLLPRRRREYGQANDDPDRTGARTRCASASGGRLSGLGDPSEMSEMLIGQEGQPAASRRYDTKRKRILFQMPVKPRAGTCREHQTRHTALFELGSASAAGLLLVRRSGQKPSMVEPRPVYACGRLVFSAPYQRLLTLQCRPNSPRQKRSRLYEHILPDLPCGT